jgi:hypothetical protein
MPSLLDAQRPGARTQGTAHDGRRRDRGWANLDRLVELLLPRPAGVEAPDDRIPAEYLGFGSTAAPPLWRNPGDVARAAGIARSAGAEALDRARERWHKTHEFNMLRTEIVALLEASGGVASADELAARLLAASAPK